MEQIIILAVIGLLSTLFSKKNKSDTREKDLPEEKPRPARTESPSPSQAPDPFKRLKELTGDMYRELQEETQEGTGKASRPEVILQAPAEAAPRKPRPAASQAAGRDTRREAAAGRSGRLTAHNPQNAQQTAEPAENRIGLDFKDGEDILKGIIFSEILGPPKSKQR